MVLGIQILGVLFGLIMLYITFLHQKRKEFTTKEYAIWVFFWLVFIFIAILPDTLTVVVRSLHINRMMDFFIIVGFMFVIGVSFYTYIGMRKTQNKVEDLVRKIAIKKAKK